MIINIGENNMQQSNGKRGQKSYVIILDKTMQIQKLFFYVFDI